MPRPFPYFAGFTNLPQVLRKGYILGRRRRFRVSTAQVPKQGLNLRRESAFCVAPVAQVSALKWNLRHLWLNLRHLRQDLRHLRLDLHHLWLNLRHRSASGLFRNSPADVRTSVAVALITLIISTLE